MSRTAVRSSGPAPDRDRGCALDREAALDEEAGRDEGRREPQPDRHEADRAEAGHGGDGWQDDRLDRHAADLGCRIVLGQHLERTQQHRAEHEQRTSHTASPSRRRDSRHR